MDEANRPAAQVIPYRSSQVRGIDRQTPVCLAGSVLGSIGCTYAVWHSTFGPPNMFTGMEAGIIGMPSLLVTVVCLIWALRRMRKTNSRMSVVAVMLCVFTVLMVVTMIFVQAVRSHGNVPGGF